MLWGFFNFVFILLERVLDFEKSKIPDFLKHIYLLFVLCMGLVLFRAENLEIALQYFRNLFGVTHSGVLSQTAWMFVREYGIFFAAAVVFSIPIAPRMNRLLAEKKIPVLGKCMEWCYPVAMSILFIVSVTYMIKGSYNHFIYFNF